MYKPFLKLSEILFKKYGTKFENYHIYRYSFFYRSSSAKENCRYAKSTIKHFFLEDEPNKLTKIFSELNMQEELNLLEEILNCRT